MFDLVEPVKGDLPCRAELLTMSLFIFFLLFFLSFPFSFFYFPARSSGPRLCFSLWLDGSRAWTQCVLLVGAFGVVLC